MYGNVCSDQSECKEQINLPDWFMNSFSFVLCQSCTYVDCRIMQLGQDEWRNCHLLFAWLPGWAVDTTIVVSHICDIWPSSWQGKSSTLYIALSHLVAEQKYESGASFKTAAREILSLRATFALRYWWNICILYKGFHKITVLWDLWHIIWLMRKKARKF